jgi:hypothetical protein
VDAVTKLRRLDRRIALLALLTLEGTKPVSRVEGFEGPDEAVAGLLRELGLEVRVSKSGCKTDIIFGRSLKEFSEAEKLKGEDRIKEFGRLFGYPRCCSEFFAGLMSGRSEGKPVKEKPLEHFACPGCKASGELMKKYREAEKRLDELP